MKRFMKQEVQLRERERLNLGRLGERVTLDQAISQVNRPPRVSGDVRFVGNENDRIPGLIQILQ